MEKREETMKRKVSQPDTEGGATGPKQGRADVQETQTSVSQSDEQRIPPSYTNTSNTDVIVLHTEQQRSAAKEHAVVNEKNGMHASTKLCIDIQSFTGMTFSNCTRLDILVDTNMCSMLMDGERLHKDAYTKFQVMERSDKKVHVINKCGGDFEQLYHQLPRNIRSIGEEAAHDGKNKSVHSVVNSGQTGGTGKNSMATGTNEGQQQIVNLYMNTKEEFQVDKGKDHSKIQKQMTSQTVDTGVTENCDPNKVELNINHTSGKEDRFIPIIDSGKEKLKTEIENVKEVDLRKGSIVITLTVSEDHIVTDGWIHSILRVLFDDMLANCTAEGDIFSVTVKRRQLCTLQLDPKVHENCVTKFEHQEEQQMLNLKVKNLESELETLKAERASGKVSEQNEDYQTSESKTDETDNDLLSESLKGDVGRVEMILSQKSVNIESQGQFGRTPVMMAVQNGHIGVVKALIKAGCEVLLFDNNGNNILHIACLSGSLDMVKYIMSLKIINKDIRGELGVTPVMMAALKGYKDIFDFLVGEGCSLSKVNAYGDNILHLASSGGNVEITAYLLLNCIAGLNSTGQYQETAVMKAVRENYVKMVSFLVGKGCDLNCLDDDGNNVLHLACTGGNVDIVKIIVSQGKIDQEGRGELGLTPVMMAAENGHFDVYKFLVERGCKLSIQDERQFNIFHLAAIGGNVKIVEHLLATNVPGTEQTNMYDMTPRQIAESRKLTPIINLIASVA